VSSAEDGFENNIENRKEECERTACNDDFRGDYWVSEGCVDSHRELEGLSDGAR